jgi:hypothetical protein
MSTFISGFGTTELRRLTDHWRREFASMGLDFDASYAAGAMQYASVRYVPNPLNVARNRRKRERRATRGKS